jgi:hypothetical protein
LSATPATLAKSTSGSWAVGTWLLQFEVARHFREVIEKQIGNKPIRAIFYSHSHYALGGGNMVDDSKSVMVLGHPKLNETVQANLQGGGAPSAIPEIGPVLTARAAIQFSNFLPTDGEDATLAAKLQVRAPAFLPVNRPVNDGETVDAGPGSPRCPQSPAARTGPAVARASVLLTASNRCLIKVCVRSFVTRNLPVTLGTIAERENDPL